MYHIYINRRNSDPFRKNIEEGDQENADGGNDFVAIGERLLKNSLLLCRRVDRSIILFFCGNFVIYFLKHAARRVKSFFAERTRQNGS